MESIEFNPRNTKALRSPLDEESYQLQQKGSNPLPYDSEV